MAGKKRKDAYEWGIMNKVLDKETIKEKFLQNKDTKESGYDLDEMYDLCEEYFAFGVSREKLYKKYTHLSRYFIQTYPHDVMMRWESYFEGTKKDVKLCYADLQRAYIAKREVPSFHLDSRESYLQQRLSYIMMDGFYKDRDSMLYKYYILGVSLDKIAKTPEDVVQFYKECDSYGLLSVMSIKEFVSGLNCSSEAEKLLVKEEMDSLGKLQEDISYLHKSISALQNELNSKIAKKKLIYKRLAIEAEDTEYVETGYKQESFNFDEGLYK